MAAAPPTSPGNWQSARDGQLWDQALTDEIARLHGLREPNGGGTRESASTPDVPSLQVFHAR